MKKISSGHILLSIVCLMLNSVQLGAYKRGELARVRGAEIANELMQHKTQALEDNTRAVESELHHTVQSDILPVIEREITYQMARKQLKEVDEVVQQRRALQMLTEALTYKRDDAAALEGLNAQLEGQEGLSKKRSDNTRLLLALTALMKSKNNTTKDVAASTELQDRSANLERLIDRLYY